MELFIGGILAGAFIAANFLQNDNPLQLDADLVASLQQHGISGFTGLLPADLFSWPNLFTLKGLILIIGGGFLVGFAIFGIIWKCPFTCCEVINYFHFSG